MFKIEATTQTGLVVQWVSSDAVNPLNQYYQFGSLPLKSELGNSFTVTSIGSNGDDGLWSVSSSNIYPNQGNLKDGDHWTRDGDTITLSLDNSNLGHKWVRLSNTDISIRS